MIAHELRQYKIQEVWHSLISIPAHFLLLAVGLTCLNYGIMNILSDRVLEVELRFKQK